MNAGLAEAIAGMEVVKGFAQERQEQRRFGNAARAIATRLCARARSRRATLPLLLYGIAVGLAFGHALLLFLNGQHHGRRGDRLYGPAGESALAAHISC